LLSPVLGKTLASEKDHANGIAIYSFRSSKRFQILGLVATLCFAHCKRQEPVPCVGRAAVVGTSCCRRLPAPVMPQAGARQGAGL